jgi:hypothetical protein
MHGHQGIPTAEIDHLLGKGTLWKRAPTDPVPQSAQFVPIESVQIGEDD